MENVYFLMIVALAILAIADLVVGVSNDAVNFLNSALGSKAISFKTLMIVASIGIAFGAIFSSGLMEVARKGIFVPSEFYFNEIIIIFMAVMITDILLLDFFNTLGMPTSTTVSIVFELLGAAVAMALIKIGADNGSIADLGNYINTAKATEIILGILGSVVIAFTIGAVVQFIARYLLTFDFQKKAKWVGAVFGGLALTSITYFIIIKGIKGTDYYEKLQPFIEGKTLIVLFISFLLWTLISFIIINVLKQNIYKLTIIIGSFALALAFAGNDLVNFIGVPIAAFQSYEMWQASGEAANEFIMSDLSKKVPTPTLFLFIAGLIMILTLWFSTKARHVTETEINLAREGEGKEKFEPNFLSRQIVRFTMLMSKYTNTILPDSFKQKIETRFTKPVIQLSSKDKTHELPAFDMVRASVNLTVASILISIATSMKLPLSTTYVTFMVAMGTSLADRAWGAESAVYRVAGVISVIGGWFFTAFIAFVAAGTIVYLLHIGGPTMVAVLLGIAVFLLARNYISHKKKNKTVKEEDRLNKAESSSVQGVIEESADNISKTIIRIAKINESTINGLINQDLNKLKKSKASVGKLENEIDDIQNNIFYFIKNLDDSYLGASKLYIDVISDLQDMAQSISFISKISHKHINNNHKALKVNQAKELKEIQLKLNELFGKAIAVFDTRSFDDLILILEEKQELLTNVRSYIQAQVERTRTSESSPKNTTLYFSILLETKDLIKATMSLLELYAQQPPQGTLK